MQLIRIALLCFALVTSNVVFAHIKDDVAKSIVRISSGSKGSTGFFWKNGKTIIATFHSIGNSSDVQVWPSGSDHPYKARIKKVHKKSDLVMIEIIDPKFTSKNYLTQLYPSKPEVDTRSFTVGYNSGTSRWISRDFIVGACETNNLKSLIPDRLHTRVTDLGFPGLDIEIIYLEGHLLHGFSGSPVVDYQGRLMGIADGGLENGAASISWCISVSNLRNLENSTESIVVLNQKLVDNLFSGDLTANDLMMRDSVAGMDTIQGLDTLRWNDTLFLPNSEEVINLGQYKFHKIKSRTFDQLDLTGKYSSTDEFGLYSLLANFRMYNYESFLYDIYVEENTGATMVIPAGETFKLMDSMITGGDEKIKFYLSLVPSLDIQQASVFFEKAVMPDYYPNWISDPQWTYKTPDIGPNNIVLTRKAFFGNNHGNYYYSNYKNYLFEALVARENYFLGAAVVKDNFQMTMQDYENWAKFVIGIQLTTFTK